MIGHEAGAYVPSAPRDTLDRMRILHTADWHLGRPFHGESLLDAQAGVIDHLVDVAREHGFRRVSLETGSMAAFAPARSLYASAGFEPCEPFGNYRASRNSVFMTRSLGPGARA